MEGAEKEFLNRKIFNTINLFVGAMGIIAWLWFYTRLWFYFGTEGNNINIVIYVIFLGLLVARVIYGVVSRIWKYDIDKEIYSGFIGGKMAWYLSLFLIVVELILCLPVVIGFLFLLMLAGPGH